MIVLGIDTALRKTGYGVVEFGSSSRLQVLDCGVIRNGDKLPHSQCLRRIFSGVEELITSFRPDALSMESAFVCKNVRTGMVLSLARGAVITSAAIKGIPVYEYSPKTAKRSAVGMGTASKEQVASVLAGIFSLDVRQIPDDATDALALALCHGNIACRPELAAGLQSL